MKVLFNLHHSDEVSGTTVFSFNGKRYAAHWTEGYSPAVVTDYDTKKTVGIIFPDQRVSAKWLKPLPELLEDFYTNARMMTPEEESEWQEARDRDLRFFSEPS